MQIITFPLGQMQANCYFLIEENSCLIIDPADEASFILEEIQRKKLHLVGMLATHGHFDHVMAAGEIQLSFKIPLYIDKKDLFLLQRLNETARYFLGYNPNIFPPSKIEYLKKGKFQISNFKSEIIASPGHTPGSCCLYFKKEKFLFTGDTLFKEGIGRYDFSYSNRDELKKSLNKLFKLPRATVIYPGHGEKTSLDKEKNIVNMFI